jgi:hypothetical protein
LRDQGLKIVGVIVGFNSRSLKELAEGLRNLGFGGAILAEIALGLAKLGVAFGEIIATLTVIGLAMIGADYIYGNQGIDLILDPRIPIPIVAPPTVEQQQGVWDHGVKICNSVSTCIQEQIH